jgi:penicillin-binding protein 2
MWENRYCTKSAWGRSLHFYSFCTYGKSKNRSSCYVENGGWGSTWAVPIASLMIEQYLTGTISRSLLEEKIKVGIIEY